MQQAVVTRSVVSPVSGGGLHRTARTRNVVARAAAVAQDRFIPPWRDVYHELKSRGLRTIAPSEAADLLKTGDWVLVDVRRPDQHEQAHPEGCVSVPMYRALDMSKIDFSKVMKIIAYSFNGVKAIEHNDNFTKEALAAAGGKKMIVMCEAGGTMRPTVSFAFGKPSRSLQAAYKLLVEGGLKSDDVAHLERGLYGWYQEELPIVGDYTPDLGRTPMAAQDPTLPNVAQSTGYELKEGDKQLQPEKKKGWFF